ncbi:MAG: hypothetical protein AB8B99_02435 [Phormidesmis sp.]
MTLRQRFTGLMALTGTALLLSAPAGWTQQQPIPANPVEDPHNADTGIESSLETSPNPAISNVETDSAETGVPSDTATSERVTPETETLVQPAAASDIIRYSDQTMSVSFPKEWEISEIENGVMVSNVTTIPAELVATQIVSIDAPPGAVVNANIDSFVEEGAAVGRYRTVTIDGQSALVMWLSNRPDELSEAIATFIGYGNQTILLFSRYAPENATAEERILQMHTSFANLAIQTAAVEMPESAE